MIRINLLPVKAAQKKEMLKGQLMVAVLTFVVACGLCGLAFVHIQGKVDEKQAEIDGKRAEIARLMKTIKEVEDFKKRQKALKSKLDVLEKLKAARTGPVYLLDELVKALPEKIWLTAFKEGKNSIDIKGVGFDEENVALFMNNLEASEYYKDVELKVTKQVKKDGATLQQFDLKCRPEKGQVDEKSKKKKK